MPSFYVSDLNIYIDCESIEFSYEKSSSFGSFSAVVANYNDGQKLNPQNGIKTVVINYRDTNYYFLCESFSNAEDFSGESFKVSGRSLTAKLDFPFADPVTESFENTSARAVIESMCSAAGVSFAWPAGLPDLLITNYLADNQQRIDIIKAVINPYQNTVYLKSLPDGSLTIGFMERNPLKLDHTNLDMDFTRDKFFSISKEWERKTCFNKVSIGNEREDESVTVTIEHEETGNRSDIKVYVVPFQGIELLHASLANVGLFYNGVKTESIAVESVVFDMGEAKVSKPVYGGLNVTWQQRSLGNVGFKENGSLTAATLGIGLADLSYTSKFHSYTMNRLNPISKTLLYVEE